MHANAFCATPLPAVERIVGSAALRALAVVLATWTAAPELFAQPSPSQRDAIEEEVASPKSPTAMQTIRLGIIGLDTSHAIAFTKILNDQQASPDVAGCRVVAAYPHGSADIPSSVSRIPGYTKEMESLGIEIVPSIAELLTRVDGVLLETNDGRLHLQQFREVLKAGKPVFIDKPVAADLADVLSIYREAEQAGVPVWSSSSLRYMDGIARVKQGAVGEVTGCDTYSPCSLEPSHADLFWYGIHGVETLYAVMGTGCESVVRVSTEGTELVAGTWKDGRVGTFRGIRSGKGGYGGTVFGTRGIQSLGDYSGYRGLVVEIAQFFRTGVVPVPPAETIELYAFMAAADESQRLGGVPVKLADVVKKAAKETSGASPVEAPHLLGD